MFDGDGFGVGLTVACLGEPPPEPGPMPEGRRVRPSRLVEVLPPGSRSRAGTALELSRVQGEKARLAAYESALVVELAAHCPDTYDRTPGAPGAASPDWAGDGHPAPGVSEFFLDELAAALGTSVTGAGSAWALHATLHDRLPGTWTALADGELDWPRARAIATEVGKSPGTEAGVLVAVEAVVLPQATGLTVTALKALVRRELVAHDAAAADRRRRWAERHADAAVRPDAEAAGRADLVVGMSTEDAHACWAAADRLACAAKAAGDPRPIGVLRAEAVRDRILGQDTDADRPPVVAEVTVVAPLDALEQPRGQRPEARGTAADSTVDPTGRRQPVGEVNGQPITATHLRHLLQRLDALCPGGLQAPTGGSLRIALTDPDGALRAVLTRPQLEGLARSGCGAHPPGADCGCGLVDRPPDVDRYRPSAAHYAFVRARDGRCRMPGCTARAAWADLDHVLPHASGGTTSCDNLCCLCRRHHRLKTFARGWSFRMEADGTLVVTSPSAVTRISRPPGMLTAGPAGRRGSRRGPASPGPAPPRHGSASDPPPF